MTAQELAGVARAMDAPGQGLPAAAATVARWKRPDPGCACCR
jgi:hypothetical protein